MTLPIEASSPVVSARRPAGVRIPDQKDCVARNLLPSPLPNSQGVAYRAPRGVASDIHEAGDASQSTRKMFDKRLLRRGFKDRYESHLMDWRSANLNRICIQDLPSEMTGRVRVCVRKRPLFQHEVQEDEFDVISVRGEDEIIVHSCLTKPDLKTLYVQHAGFRFSEVIDVSTLNDEAYRQCAGSAVQHALDGGTATIFMFGQTGSGKTFTMDSIIQSAAEDIFGMAGMLGRDVNLSAFEIAGKTIRDLFAVPGCPSRPTIMQDDRNHTRVVGLVEREARSAEELTILARWAKSARATRATQVHSASSRSHAVLRFTFGTYETEGRAEPSSLTLVDCAGTERREDSSHHDGQSQKETAEINASLFALKECFRALRSPNSQRPPYRESFLTRVLAPSFSNAKAQVVAIGTVSPAASDTEHSLTTLRALQQLQGTQPTFEVRDEAIASVKSQSRATPHPKLWTEEEVREWLISAVGGRAAGFTAKLSKGTDGKHLVRWSAARFTQLCGGDATLAEMLYQDLHRKLQK